MYEHGGGAGGACYATSTSSATSEGVGATGARRMRLVRLSRPRRSPKAYGFAVRGGREHSAGFFVSNVEPESEAFHGGLQIGDQVITLNGFRVDDAVHSELSHYIAGQNRLKMKVRNVGMVPVKDKCNDSLTWRLVCNDGGASSTSTSTTSHSPPPVRPLRPIRTHLTLQVPAHAKLGCGICKGPDWKPGIYVQFVKEHGIAKEAGLRPGDQILSCNGIDFREIQFSDAISVMKKSPRLELTLCPGGGLDLVSPESSGYNSSASSATGDRSPPADDHNKRLSIVTEETTDLGDRLIHLENNRLKRHWENMDYQWKTGTLTNRDPPSDIEPDYDTASISPEINHSYNHSSNNFITNPQNKTVINLTENGATIECRYNNDKKMYTIDGIAKIYNGCSNQHISVEKKTVVVEVHHNNKSHGCMLGSMNGESVDSGNTDASSISSSTTLSSAITEELQRRKQKKSSEGPRPQAHAEQPSEWAVPRRVPCRPEDNQKKKQHDALMDEFKKVHRRMFQHDHTQGDSLELDRQLSNKSVPRVERLERPTSATNNNEDVPPPPPPMPLNGTLKKEVNGTTTTNSSKQSTPTPDYEVRSVEELAAKINLRTHSKDEMAEMESIESYTMKNPTSPKPRPPSTYFVRPPNGTATLKKARPVSVTIGEYPSNVGRKEPAKLEFLSDARAGKPADETDSSLPIAGRLQSELLMTLSRSNLKMRMEAQAKNMNNNVITKCKTEDSDTISNDSDVSENQNFHKRYGHNILPVAPSISIPKVPIVKCSSNGLNKNSAFNLAREALGNKLPLGKTESLPLNGIMKDKLANGNIGTLKYDNHKKISFDHSNIIMTVGDKK